MFMNRIVLGLTAERYYYNIILMASNQ